MELKQNNIFYATHFILGPYVVAQTDSSALCYKTFINHNVRNKLECCLW
jgi:hypothetical protein